MSALSYISTRGQSSFKDFGAALLDGLASDGGLYVPNAYPTADADLLASTGGDYGGLTEKLLRLFGADVLGDEAVKLAAARTKAAFLRDGQTPLTKLHDKLFILELWHGPTLAFKDMAMQMIAPLTDAALEQRGETLTLVTATSGDTGAAAVRAFAGSKRVKLVVFHPLGRVSPVQRLQMTTEMADNVLNVGVSGDFDDCQRIVKALLSEPSLKQNGLISSVNSINWGRLLGQIPYYLAAGAASGVKSPDFVVPTGNFGDAFAGWAARKITTKIGCDIGAIHCAVNSNDALNQALNLGRYVRTQAVETASVSMDVQAPSNFERLVFEAYGRDAAATKTFFETFASQGEVSVSPALQAALKAEVSASKVTEDETKATIKYAYDTWGQVICPHTAVALKGALDRKVDTPQIVLSTAHAAKFPAFVEAALGFAPEVPDAIKALYGRSERIKEASSDIAEAVALVKGFATKG